MKKSEFTVGVALESGGGIHCQFAMTHSILTQLIGFYPFALLMNGCKWKLNILGNGMEL